MNRARIIGVGAYAPKRILTNAELEKMVETSDEWIVQRTGIRERHIVDEGEATSDLAIRAAQQAMERAQRHAGGDRLHRGGHHHAATCSSPPPPTSSSIGWAAATRARSTSTPPARARSTACPSAPSTSQTGKYRTRAVHRRRVPLAHHRLHRPRHLHPARRRGGRRGAAARRPTTRHHRHRSLLGRPLRRPPDPARGRLAASRHPRDGRPAHALRQDEGQRGLQGRGADVRRLRRAHPEEQRLHRRTTSTSSSRTRRTSASSRRR